MLNSKAQYWIDTAQYDIETAHAMVETKRYLYVGFLCHLTTEKVLKAAIANGNEETIPPKIHDLVKLSKQSQIYTLMSDEQKDFLEILLPLNIESRYPSYKEDIAKLLDEKLCNSLIKRTEELICWIKQQL